MRATIVPRADNARRVDADVVSGAKHDFGHSFPELVWAHYRWQCDLHAAETLHVPSESEYREVLRAFESRHGKIANAYWCQHEASAVAITRKTRSGRSKESEMRFHSATHWVTDRTPEVADVLHDCDSLAVRISEILRGTSELIALQLLLTCAGHLLAAADYADRPPGARERAALVRRQKAELGAVSAYYRRAGAQAARIVYVRGMIRGAFLCVILATLAVGLALAFTGLSLHDSGMERFVAVCAAGAVGATVSVLSRMASPRADAFSIDFEVGRKSIRWLGAIRPVTGAIFALAAYFALRSELVAVSVPANDKAIYFYVVVAFTAGFSERWARVMMTTAEQKVVPGLHTRATPEDESTQAARPRSAETASEAG
jgi:hypothetical protein